MLIYWIFFWKSFNILNIFTSKIEFNCEKTGICHFIKLWRKRIKLYDLKKIKPMIQLPKPKNINLNYKHPIKQERIVLLNIITIFRMCTRNANSQQNKKWMILGKSSVLFYALVAAQRTVTSFTWEHLEKVSQAYVR